ncbi:hypothetical protein [Luteolibacter sp. Populi]|uniref:hypothetical protein n=1 Tax=Luteolibacter sp. Populi TaxID=3230487 RepID=UPI003467D501
MTRPAALLVLGLLLVSPISRAAEARADLRIEKSKSAEEEDVKLALAAVLDRTQLDEISARLALETAWSLDADQTAERLGKVLAFSVRAKGASALIQASDPSPVMAATLSNTAASVLRDHLERGVKEITKLDRKLTDQRDAVADRRKFLASIIRKGKIISQQQGEAPQTTEEPKEAAPKAEEEVARYVDAKGDFERASAELATLESQRAEVKEIAIHHILWARAVPAE